MENENNIPNLKVIEGGKNTVQEKLKVKTNKSSSDLLIYVVNSERLKESVFTKEEIDHLTSKGYSMYSMLVASDLIKKIDSTKVTENIKFEGEHFIEKNLAIELVDGLNLSHKDELNELIDLIASYEQNELKDVSTVLIKLFKSYGLKLSGKFKPFLDGPIAG